MPDAVVLRFPARRPEYRLSERKPNVGDLVKRNGAHWMVVAVAQEKDGATVVTLRPGLQPA